MLKTIWLLGVALAVVHVSGPAAAQPASTLPTVTISKISLNGTGTFDFTGNNGLVAQSITTSVAGTTASAPMQTLTAANVVTTISEGVPPAGYTLSSASCTGMGTGGTATLTGSTLTLNAAATASGSNIACTFNNTGSLLVVPPIPPTVTCSTNPAVYNTGYNGATPFAAGRDTVWESGEGTVSGGPGSVTTWQRSYVGNQAPGAWVNSPYSNANWVSQYIGHTQPNRPVDIYHRFTFNLDPGVTPSSLSLKLDFYSDNSVTEIFVNGVLQSVTGVPQGGSDPYNYQGYLAGMAASTTLANNWRNGSNTLVIHVKSGPDAEGFLAQATTTAVCPTQITLSKTTTGAAGGPFGFTLTNTTQASGTVTTSASGTSVQVDGDTTTPGLQPFTAKAYGTDVTIAENAAPGWNLTSASCTDASNVIGSLGTGANARTYTVPATSIQSAKKLQCLFTNAASSTVTTRKISLGKVGTFGFTGSNGLGPQSIVTTTVGTAVAAAIQTLTTPGVITTLTEDPLPARYTLTSVSCTGLGANGTATYDLPNRKVTLDAASTAVGSNVICTFTNTYPPPTVQLVKVTTSGTGSNLFSFALSGLSASTDSITVVGVGTANGATTLIGTVGLEVSVKETSPAGWPVNPVSASCLDSASATPTVPFGTLTGNQLTIPVANMVPGATITCTFTNSFSYSVTGRVFIDNGLGSGTANDGVINGTEAGLAGVSVRLTNCVSTTAIATALTDSGGNYSLAVPFATATGTSLCVEETNLGTCPGQVISDTLIG